MSNKRNHTDMDTLIADVAEALYEGDKDVERAVNVVGLISIVVPPLSKFLDTINNEVDRLAMADGYDELPIIRGGANDCYSLYPFTSRSLVSSGES